MDRQKSPPALRSRARAVGKRLRASRVPSPGSNFTERLATDLGRRLTALEAAAIRTRSDGDGEALHDLRVASRELASALWVWRGLLAKRPVRRLLRRLRRVRRAAGRMREWQVESIMLRELACSLEETPRLATESLAARLERRIRRGALGAAKATRDARMLGVRTLVARAVASSLLHGGDAPRALERAREAVKELERRARGALVEALASREDALLHAARIAVKRWRYANECLVAVTREAESGALGDVGTAATLHARRTRFPAPAAALRDLQRALGQLQDLAGLRARSARRARRLRERGRVAEADGLLAAAARLSSERAAPLAEVERLVTTLDGGNEADLHC